MKLWAVDLQTSCLFEMLGLYIGRVGHTFCCVEGGSNNNAASLFGKEGEKPCHSFL